MGFLFEIIINFKGEIDMVPYYILGIEAFDITREAYGTDAQRGIQGVNDHEPRTEFNKHESQIIEGYMKYDLRCETFYNHRGRAYGVDRIFERFILISDKHFYYSANSNILIMSTPKDVFNKFYKDFQRDGLFRFKKIEIDFNKIIKNQHALGIEGIWLGKLSDININALLLLGTKIEDSNQYQQLVAGGAQVTNISIVYNYNNKQEKIMITKDGGIILYEHKNETDALLLSEHIYTNLLIS